MSLNTTIKTNPAESYIPSSFLTKLNSDNPSITYVDIIELANSSPEVYAIIKNDLLTYDEQFSRLINTLKNERDSIIIGTKNKLSALKETHDSKIISDKSYLNQGVYISDILSKYKNIFGDYVNLFEFLKWGSILSGIYILFAIKWSVGLVTGILGYFIFNSLVLTYKSRINLCSSKAGYSEEDIFNLKNISGGLRGKIEEEANSLKLKLDSLINNFSKEYKYIEDQENLILSQKLLDFDESKNSTIQVNQNNIIKAILNINRDLALLEEHLNQLPETFDNTNLEWNKIKYTNNKDNVANLLRIGYNLVTININNHSHSFKIPFTIPFLNQTNISFNCTSDENAKWAIKLSYNLISRVLLSLPASKTKLTFIDPLELGGNAAPFTPLLREIYGGMVFTQPNDIDNQLSILTRAIENVIQRYLQDKFKDIGEYNLRTKEVPEPYRLLIVYNFPHGFNDTTTHKLLNILKSGPRAGVHTILVNDRNAKLPYGFNWETLDNANLYSVPLLHSKSDQLHFSFDEPLPYSAIVDNINKEFPNASSIKVNFTNIPNQSEFWKEKAHKFYAVPIGRHALEVQNLTFDNDDDNQALLIGKPGSGKSNLLHVIIANSLWKYSPDQLEIYLIDFKGGVEFTIYADKKIPHIRTIAIESEREFGLSVLDGVEKELLRREMEFSKGGVQNIAQFHEMFPEVKMPRVLLIVDEFQEFFAEDDAIKIQVDDKFDRIIRKGRAFGINTLFSSQSLAGKSINKSTKELIDIRIALMCSDLDANTILDDRNPAAKDLTRPGEGIYNAENGKLEGNRRFQAFFIEKADLIRTIDAVVSYSQANFPEYSNLRQIVFRGSEKAEIEKENHPIRKLTPISNPKSIKLWVGEPVAIADEVKATLRKQGGSNLLIAGHDEKIGLRIMYSAIISISKQHIKGSCKFLWFSFYNVDSDLAEKPGLLFENINQESAFIAARDVKEELIKIKTEITQRIAQPAASHQNIYLSFFSLQRGRAFRKEGYSMSEEGNILAYILKEGPDVGIFTLIQVDTMDNFSRNLDDMLLKEFSQRIGSQMNPDNSVKLIGNQKAARLGNNRAIYIDDNENILVKFKPYEFPSLDWMAQNMTTQSDMS